MAEESKKDVGESVTSTETEKKKTTKKRGVFSRLWNAMTRSGKDDFEKRLQHISKEEASILARVSRRSLSWRRMARRLIIFSVLLEVIAVGYAIMTTRTLNMNWQMRALRVLPMFLLPALSGITYYALGSYTRMRDRKDHKTLERLRGERQEKINELKEKTNYYITQQLIQRYDPDPAAKAAAATVLASKLGADSGLKLFVGDDHNAPSGRSNDVEVAARTSSGLRNRKASHTKTNSVEQALTHHTEDETIGQTGLEGANISQQGQLIVEHHNPQVGLSANDGGWIARVAALLVGEDPTQSYALICGNCHMHNGLARKEEYPFITYYCPHCHALNKPKQSVERSSGSISPAMTSTPTVYNAEIVPSAGASTGDPISPSAGASTGDTIAPATDSPLAAAVTGTSES